eukprot:Gb_14315 [translate_table: standard]
MDGFVGSWPSKPAAYREVASRYSTEVRGLVLKLLAAISETLGLEPDFLDKALGQHGQHMAINYYPQCPDPELTFGLPPHSDPNVITVLLQDEVSGLQVLENQQWIAVHPIPNSFVVNIGDQLQMASRKSRAGNTNSQISAGKEIVQERHFSNLDGCNKKSPSKEMGDVGGGLHLLIDAIQLLEEEELHKSIKLQAQKKVFIPVLEKNVATNTFGRPSLENQQSLVDSDLGTATDLASAEVDQQGKCQCSSKRISNCGDMDRGVKPLGRSKSGRLQALPSMYYDYVLQPWKKCARKVPTCASS